MKTRIKHLFLLPALAAGLGLMPVVRVTAQTITNLHSFTGSPDGELPLGGLMLSGSTLYGTAWGGGSGGGSSGNGTVFAVSTNGTEFRVLHSFTAGTGSIPNLINSDGAVPPNGALVLSGNTLYGAAFYGGSSGNGTVFAVNTNGTGFTILHSFTGPSDGARPYAGLTLSGNTLYGTANGGGSSGDGTVFSLSFPPPQLTIIPSGSTMILTWPTNYAGFDYTGYTLESTTNLVSPVWATNSPAPVVVNGQNVVTNSITGSQQFYQLIQ